MRKVILFGCLLSFVLIAGCAGLNTQGKTFVADGTCLNILTLQLPQDPLALAVEKVPEGAVIQNVNASPTDLGSLPGLLCRLMGLGRAQIGGTIE